MIDNNGHARLTDFGLLEMISEESSCGSGGAASIRWMSPELLVPGQFGLEESHPTKESDCYALGMVIYEVLSGETPFAQYVGPVVLIRVLKGERPRRPPGKLITDGIWKMLNLCWKAQPRDRINANGILLGLGENPSSRPALGMGGDVATDVSGPSGVTASDSSMFSSLHCYFNFVH